MPSHWGGWGGLASTCDFRGRGDTNIQALTHTCTSIGVFWLTKKMRGCLTHFSSTCHFPLKITATSAGWCRWAITCSVTGALRATERVALTHSANSGRPRWLPCLCLPLQCWNMHLRPCIFVIYLEDRFLRVGFLGQNVKCFWTYNKYFRNSFQHGCSN